MKKHLHLILIMSFFLIASACSVEGSTLLDLASADTKQKVEKNNQGQTPEGNITEKTTLFEKPKETGGSTEQIPVELHKLTDGDTASFLYSPSGNLSSAGQVEKFRFLLIDTPETNHPKLGEQPFGREAKERTAELLQSGQITVEFDIGERVDKYGRLLAYIYVNGKSVQETLLEEGLARVAYVYPPNTRYLNEFNEAERRAKEKKIGIWSIEGFSTPKGFDTDAVSS